jgi:uncharacterized protein (DUF1501 family)
VNRPHIPTTRRDLDRRSFLKALGAAGVTGAAGAVGLSACSDGSTGGGGSVPDEPVGAGGSPSTSTGSAASPGASIASRGDAAGRVLVVIELSGGNDGLAMLQPTGAGVLHDVRPTLLTELSELVDAGDGFGWHPGLAPVARHGIGAVVGIGSEQPDLSHFEMEQRWWRGMSTDGGRAPTGFLGRVCDELDVGAPVTGVSLSGSQTPALLSARAVTGGIRDASGGWLFADDSDWTEALWAAMETVGSGAGERNATTSWVGARRGVASTVRLGDALDRVEMGDDERYPWTEVGQQLRSASALIGADVGLRVVHVRMGGYDTHSGQEWEYPALMEDLGVSLAAFVEEIDERGLSDRVLVATTSEFGRRVSESDGGTDHGGASTMLVCGAGASGVHGDPPSLQRLDDGNVVATARFEDYYATLSAWLGVDPDLVLPTGGDRIDGLLA